MLYSTFSSAGPEGVLEVRITRRGGGTRVRWGYWPHGAPNTPRWTGGDVTLTDEEIHATGHGPLLPNLARSLAERFPIGEERWTVVFLQMGTGVRTIDMLRVVECAGGSREVLFLPWPFGRKSLRLISLPVPGDEADARLLEEDLFHPRRPILNVTAEGEVSRKGEISPPELILLEGGEGILLRPDREVRWSICRTILSRAEAAGLAIDLAFAPSDPRIDWERVLRVPVAKDGERLDLPDDAPADEAFQMVLRRMREGATAFSFR